MRFVERTKSSRQKKNVSTPLLLTEEQAVVQGVRVSPLLHCKVHVLMQVDVSAPGSGVDDGGGRKETSHVGSVNRRDSAHAQFLH